MKKWIALLLVAVLCLSLAACGGKAETSGNDTQGQQTSQNTQQTGDKSSKTEPKEQIIEITLDNWQEYFEMRRVPRVLTNLYNEFHGIAVEYAFCLKDSVANKVTGLEQLVFDVEYTDGYACLYNYNMDTQELTVSEFVEADAPYDAEYFLGLLEVNHNGTIDRVLSLSDVVQGYRFTWNMTDSSTHTTQGNTVQIYGADYLSIEITKIQGIITVSE